MLCNPVVSYFVWLSMVCGYLQFGIPCVFSSNGSQFIQQGFINVAEAHPSFGIYCPTMSTLFVLQSIRSRFRIHLSQLSHPHSLPLSLRIWTVPLRLYFETTIDWCIMYSDDGVEQLIMLWCSCTKQFTTCGQWSFSVWHHNRPQRCRFIMYC